MYIYISGVRWCFKMRRQFYVYTVYIYIYISGVRWCFKMRRQFYVYIYQWRAVVF